MSMSISGRSVSRWAACVLLVLLSAAPAGAQINWQVTFNDQVNATGIGFGDPTLGATRRATFLNVLNNIINTQLDARGTVNLLVTNSNSNPGDPTLAMAGPFSHTPPNPGFVNGTLFEKATSGAQPLGGNDAQATFNFGHTWNSGTGAPAANEFDLTSV